MSKCTQNALWSECDLISQNACGSKMKNLQIVAVSKSPLTKRDLKRNDASPISIVNKHPWLTDLIIETDQSAHHTAALRCFPPPLSVCLFVCLRLRSSSVVLCSNCLHHYIHPELTCSCGLLINSASTHTYGTYTEDTFNPFVNFYIDLGFILTRFDSRSRWYPSHLRLLWLCSHQLLKRSS